MSETTRPSAAQSPCNGVCRMNTEPDLCEGCGRTIVEIAEWGEMSDSARADVRALLPLRMASIRRQTEGSPESGPQ